MNLGELKQHIESFPEGTTFEYSLSDPFSWRGSYDEVAFNVLCNGNLTSREELLEKIEKALTESFYGYKGGQYSYHEFTDVHFEEDTRSYTDGKYTAEWIAELEKSESYKSQEHRLVNLLFPNK